MDLLQLLQAEKACRDVVLSAAQAVDQQQYEALVALFTEDATLVRPGGALLRGRSEILAAYMSKDPNRITHHLVCNHQVTFSDSGMAESRCKVLLYASHKHRDLTPQGRLADPTHQVGVIVDTLSLTEQGWKIQNRNAWFELLIQG